jgi:hypothetical protein
MFDYTHILKDAGAVTSSGFGEVDSTAKVINLGEGLVRMNLIIDIDFIKCSAGDELYTLHLMGGDDESFTETVSLCSKELGAPASLQGNLVSKISRVVIPVQNEQGGTIYPYVRLRYVISGTNPSINFSARLEKDLWYEGWTSLATTTTA